MLIKRSRDCNEFLAGDGCMLREYLNPAKEPGLSIRYSLAHAKVPPKGETKPHSLTHSEVYCIISGHGVMNVNGNFASVEEGAVVYIPPGSTQNIKNTGNSDLMFLCIVDPAWTPECEIVPGP